MSRIFIPSGHYAVVEWEYGSEEGQTHIDGVTTKDQAIALCKTVTCSRYRLNPRKLIIKGVYIAGKAQAVGQLSE